MRIAADANIQAMRVLGTDQAVRANNVANVSTDGFRPSRVDLETGPEGRGLRVARILKEADPGPLVLRGNKFVQGSGTDLAREMTGMMTTQNAFAANAVAVRAWDQTLGLVVSLKA